RRASRKPWSGPPPACRARRMPGRGWSWRYREWSWSGRGRKRKRRKGRTQARPLVAGALGSWSFLTGRAELLRDELLPAVDVEGRTGNRGVRHEVERQHGYVSRADDAADRQRRTELLAALVQLTAEDRRRQGCVDETGRDEVHADRRELERQIPDERGT